MCLPVTPYKIEREWKHQGLTCAATQNSEAGFRCGYVRVPPSHPLHGKHYDEMDINVHGGLTFAEIEPCDEHEDGRGWWFGFDCAHFMDRLVDPSADLTKVTDFTRWRIEIDQMFPSHKHEEHYWTRAEVEAETEKLAEQLAA